MYLDFFSFCMQTLFHTNSYVFSIAIFFWLVTNEFVALNSYLFIGEYSILSIRTTKHNLNFNTFYLLKCPYWPPPNPNTVGKLKVSAFQRYKGLGVADRVFLTKLASAQYGWGCDFTEFDGANNIQPFFVIRKSWKNSYKLFYVSGKLPEQLSSVTSCDMFCIFVWRDVNSRT